MPATNAAATSQVIGDLKRAFVTGSFYHRLSQVALCWYGRRHSSKPEAKAYRNAGCGAGRIT
jgi:hypothetical protein